MTDPQEIVAEKVVESPGFWEMLGERVGAFLTKVSFDDSPWSGSASNWDSAEAYCSDCLIDLNDAGQPKTKDKCKLPYRKPGSSAVNLGALRAIASGARGLAATNAPAAAKQAAARKVAGWWRSAFKKDPPPGIARLASGNKSKSVMLFKDDSGKWWFFGIYSNKYEDKDKEILSSQSHEEYAVWLKESGFRPIITLYHQPQMPRGFWQAVIEKYIGDPEKLDKIVSKVYSETGFAKAKHVQFFNGFATVLAEVLDGKEWIAEKLADIPDLGMSHGFIVMDMRGNVINKYRTFEMSVLKGNRAANLLTRASLVHKEDKDMTKAALTSEDRAFLEEILTPEVVDSMVSKTEKAEELLDMALAFKEGSETEESEPEVTPDAEPEEEAPAGEGESASEEGGEESDEKVDETPAPAGDEAVQALATEVAKVLEQAAAAISGISEQVTSLTEKIQEMELKLETKANADDVALLQADEDEKIARQYYLPPISFTGFSPTKSEKTEVAKEKADEVVKDGPVGETGNVDPNNMLQKGLWDVLKTQAPIPS